MKKILALSLAMVLVLGLAACGGSGSQSSTASAKSSASAEASAPAAEASAPADASAEASEAPAADGSKAYPNCNEDGSINLDTIAHYDYEYDYTKDEKIKVAYIAQAGTALYQQSAEAYEHWAPLFNMEWAGFMSADGDSDMFLTDLQTMIDQGVTAFILDPDGTTFPAVINVLEQNNKDGNLYWMSQMSPPRDAETGDGIPIGGNMINNYVGFDNVESGRQVTRRLIQWKEENLPDVDWGEIGFLMMEFSLSPELMQRHEGSHEVFLEAGGKEENYFMCDCVSTGMTMQGAMDAAGPIVSSNPQIKYWLCNGLFDDLAQGAAAIFDQQGLTDTSAICVFGGSALIQQWDAGQEDSFRFAVFTAQTLYAEPIIGALRAFANGWADPDTIWPSWIKPDDHGVDPHTYSTLLLPTESLEHDTYKHYLEWTDMYTKSDMYDYSQDGINMDDFTPFVDVPETYKQ